VSPFSPIAPGAALAAADPTAGRLAALARTPPGAARREAANELQVVFLTQLIRALRATVPESDFLPRAPSRDIYDGVFDRAVAEAMARTDPLGLVRQLGGGGGAQDSDTPSR
jgi:Rod binding domain-containing protein